MTGLIPACAGKTVVVGVYVAAARAHPRVCGENCGQREPKGSGRGSSPRVRGKRQRLRIHRVNERLIPACAGKTRLDICPNAPVTAHPRVCGENLWIADSALRRPGSSPRVRGKLIAVRVFEGSSGLIPACAGKTRLATKRAQLLTAHPRVCGENEVVLQGPFSQSGSSPRVRGKHPGRNVVVVEHGLIPACAGKTRMALRHYDSPRAHPRVCGENLPLARGKRHSHGSSPRVRGKQEGPAMGKQTVGLIPACAGKTPRVPCSHLMCPAHPRVCGENINGLIQGIKNMGSSPRVRGKH